MATIENLGASYIRRLELTVAANRQASSESNRTEAKKTSIKSDVRVADLPVESRRTEEAEHRETSTRRGRAHENDERFHRMSLDELAEMLRKVNLTFDLFEIQAIFSIDQKTGDVTVEVINQRTGEVIRKIPPYDIGEMVDALETGESVLTDIKA
jgi:uncharacterized FlaG/YvyC family protein